MIATQQLADEVKAITTFCITNKGKCFNGWEPSKIFRFIAFHLLSGSLFVTRNTCAGITGVAIAWPADSGEVGKRFEWRLPEPGNALFIADVIGKRSVCGELWRMALDKWPKVSRAFAYRRKDGKPKLVEFSMRTLNRFYK